MIVKLIQLQESRVVKLDNKFIDNIKSLVQTYWGNDYIFDIINIRQAIKSLDKLFSNLSGKIDLENNGKYVTNDLENKVSRFAFLCAEYLVEGFEEISKNVSKDKIINLFKHRHLGYGFYSCYSKSKAIIENEQQYEEVLYRALATYFYNFYGNFSNNELAIQMLCEYYPKDIEIEEEIKNIVISALFSHIRNAGSPGDFGYAYGGIFQIKKGIGKLPIEIVDTVLKNYEFYNITNEMVYRKQVHAIIDNSSLNEKKKLYKFFFLDSVVIANIVGRIMYLLYKDEIIGVKHAGVNYEKCADNRMVIWTEGEKENIDCVWEYSDFQQRTLRRGTKQIAAIIYRENTNKIVIRIYDTKEKEKEIGFDYNDYVLNEYNNGEFEDDLEQFILTHYINNKKFLFSHIWLDDLRGIKEQQLSFDNRYVVKKRNDNLKLQKRKDCYQQSMPKDFFSKAIYSLSAIVGKNGSGKTSALKFLRDDFFKLIYLIDNKGITIEDGIVSENNIINEDIKYIVVIRIGEQDYFISSEKKLQYLESNILPYKPRPLNKKSENSKIVYFSSMINPYIELSQFKNNSINIQDKVVDLLKSINTIGCVDLSTNRFFQEENIEYINLYSHILKQNEEISKENILDNSFKYRNKDFWMQLAFFDAHKEEEFKKWFGFSKTKLRYEQESIDFGNVISKLESFDISKKNFENIMKAYYESSKSSRLKFNCFSAGELAKYSFLSKLYWSIDGYNKYSEILEKYDRNLFDITDTVLDNSSAILFIDEGELYYHPEWQRTYISTLIELVDKYIKYKNITLQIVITSNSPFIISDLPSENVMFLPDGLQEKEVLTFGSNIHTLLRNGFFMENTIGEFAKNKINNVIMFLKEKSQMREKNDNYNINEDEGNIYKQIIDLIGEPIIKNKLEKMYYEVFTEDLDMKEQIVLYKNKVKDLQNEIINGKIIDQKQLKTLREELRNTVDKIDEFIKSGDNI
jgi:hypothetical protein